MFKTSAQLRLENLALRQQLGVLRRSAPKRLKLTPADRIFWVWLRRVWSNWRSALRIVKPDTVIAWHRKGFRLVWSGKIRGGKRGRPSVPSASNHSFPASRLLRCWRALSLPSPPDSSGGHAPPPPKQRGYVWAASAGRIFSTLSVCSR